VKSKLPEQVNLATIAGGAAVELFEQELGKVVENILDPNTEADAARTITLTIKLKPNNERNIGSVSVAAKSSLAAFRAASTQMFFGRLEGRPVAVEHDPKQLQMEFDEVSKPRAIREGGES